MTLTQKFARRRHEPVTLTREPGHVPSRGRGDGARKRGSNAQARLRAVGNFCHASGNYCHAQAASALARLTRALVAEGSPSPKAPPGTACQTAGTYDGARRPELAYGRGTGLRPPPCEQKGAGASAVWRCCCLHTVYTLFIENPARARHPQPGQTARMTISCKRKRSVTV